MARLLIGLVLLQSLATGLRAQESDRPVYDTFNYLGRKLGIGTSAGYHECADPAAQRYHAQPVPPYAQLAVPMWGYAAEPMPTPMPAAPAVPSLLAPTPAVPTLSAPLPSQAAPASPAAPPTLAPMPPQTFAPESIDPAEAAELDRQQQALLDDLEDLLPSPSDLPKPQQPDPLPAADRPDPLLSQPVDLQQVLEPSESPSLPRLEMPVPSSAADPLLDDPLVAPTDDGLLGPEVDALLEGDVDPLLETGHRSPPRSRTKQPRTATQLSPYRYRH